MSLRNSKDSQIIMHTPQSLKYHAITANTGLMHHKEQYPIKELSTAIKTT